MKFIQEKQLIGTSGTHLLCLVTAPPKLNVFSFGCICCVNLFPGKYFDEISQDTGRFCFGVEDTMKALEMGAVETLILWENLDVGRFTLKDRDSEETSVCSLGLRPSLSLCLDVIIVPRCVSPLRLSFAAGKTPAS